MRSNEQTGPLRENFYLNEILKSRGGALPIGFRSCGQNTGWRRSLDSATHLEKKSYPPRRRQALRAHVAHTISRDSVADGRTGTGSLLPYGFHMQQSFTLAGVRVCALFSPRKGIPDFRPSDTTTSSCPAPSPPPPTMEILRDAVARLEELLR